LSKIAFISDVHSNEEALLAVLSRLDGYEVYCLGDVVGYGASPNEVVDHLRRHHVKGVRGNHDEAALTGRTSHFNARAAMAAVWTAGALTPDSREYLGSLPLELRSESEGMSIYMTHGSPDDRLWEYVYPQTHSGVFVRYLTMTSADLVALGHTHIPFEWEEDAGIVLNPGSVGQPRDRDWRASYSTVEVRGGKATVENHRVEYDVELAASKIRKAGLPGELAARLASGT
jgi:putative phosphoesterase